MEENQSTEWLKDNWFKILIVVLSVAAVFLLARGFVFTPEAAYETKKQKCLLTMKKTETIEKEYDSITSTPEYASSTDEELRNITNNLLDTFGLKQEDIYECWAFLEVGGVDYSARDKANKVFR